MKEFSQEMVLFHDVASSVIYPAKGKHSREGEHTLSISRSFRFHVLKSNNSDECE